MELRRAPLASTSKFGKGFIAKLCAGQQGCQTGISLGYARLWDACDKCDGWIER